MAKKLYYINSATTEVTLLQRQQQQQQYPNNHYESSENNQTELHRFGQNADRFTTSGGTNITTVRSDFFHFLVVGQRAASFKN